MKSRNLICSILIFTALISIATPLYTSQGYIMLLSLVLVLLLGWKEANKKSLKSLCIIVIVYIIYIVTTPSLLNNTSRLSVSAIMVVSMCVFSIIVPTYLNEECMTCRNGILIDITYIMFYVVCIYELLIYTAYNINDWAVRGNLENATFFAGYHQVDFSIIIMIIFTIGIKRNFMLLSFVLAIVSWIILPARIMKLFFLIFIIFSLLKDKIYKFCKNNIFFNRCFKLMFFSVVGILFLSIIWIFVLNKYLTVVEGHMGLYDTSNFERCQTIIYAFQVIIQEKLVFCGVDVSSAYSSIIKNSMWTVLNGPHNTYISLILQYSAVFGGAYLLWLSKLVDRIFSIRQLPYIFSYLICGCILHDMLTGIRGLMFITLLLIPYKKPIKYNPR